MTTYRRYVRHSHFDRTRHSTEFLKFLDEQATKFSTTPDVIFDYMKYQGYTAEQIRTATALPPTLVEAPVISGTAQEGQILSTTDGTWNGSPTITYEYQWERNATPISGATSSTYTLVTADVDTFISVQVTATNTVGSASATSGVVGPVAAL